MRHVSRKAKVGAAIILLVVIIAVIGLYYAIYADQQSYLKEGCTPIAWNEIGAATMWDCPPGVTKGVGVTGK